MARCWVASSGGRVFALGAKSRGFKSLVALFFLFARQIASMVCNFFEAQLDTFHMRYGLPPTEFGKFVFFAKTCAKNFCKKL